MKENIHGTFTMSKSQEANALIITKIRNILPETIFVMEIGFAQKRESAQELQGIPKICSTFTIRALLEANALIITKIRNILSETIFVMEIGFAQKRESALELQGLTKI